MTVIVRWQDREYDIDPLEMSTRELDLIEQRTGFKLSDLVGGFADQANVPRALFWVVDRRQDQALDFGTYDGPPMRVVLESAAEYYKTVGAAMGKAASTLPSEPDGSPSSPSGTPGAAQQPLTY